MDEDEDAKKAPQRIARTEPAPKTEEAKGSDVSDAGAEEDDEFDAYMNAQPTTDRTGITGKQRQKALDKQTVTFSSGKVDAPSRQGY